MTDDTALVTALRTMQVRGAIGESSLELAIAHADQFVASVPGTATTLVPTCCRVPCERWR